MNEIRFTQPAPPIPDTPKEKTESVHKKEKNKSSLVFLFSLVFKIILVLGILYAGLWAYKYFYQEKGGADSYSAVFLSNDQVYFGNILENKRGEIVLKDVYYLQNAGTDFSPNGESLQGSTFTLVKLGQELHGPTDEMYINKDNVLFYEYLRPDSQVVKTIENYKNK